MADPMHQFEVQRVVTLPQVTIPGVGPVDLSITNSTISMFAAAGLITLFLAAVTARPAVVPGRTQTVGELLFGLIDDLAHSIMGHAGRAYFPFVFTLFLFILFMNLLGMFMVFTATSQIAVTATLGIMTIALVVAVGIARRGLGFFKLFVPSGVPVYMLPLIVPIEIISFLIRPVTLALRLFGNMLGGHVVLKVFAGFIVTLGTLGVLGWLGALLALGSVVALTALEFMVAFLQAFVFAVLACVYLNDVAGDAHH